MAVACVEMKVAAFVVLFLLIVSTVIIVARFDLSAIPAPTRFETRAASTVRHWIISRKAREHPVPEPFNDPVSVASGGWPLTGIARSVMGRMEKTLRTLVKPCTRACPALRVLKCSNGPMQNCSGLSGTGTDTREWRGFGKTLTDDQIWDLVHYIRSLRDTNPAGSQPEPKIPH